jgi:adenine phosphoribosyltransferase
LFIFSSSRMSSASSSTPSHGLSNRDSSAVPAQDKPATASHPSASKPDPTEHAQRDAQRGLSTSASSSATELSSLQVRLRSALRQFPDFPSPGILFEDILPIFQNPELHESLLRALEIHIKEAYGEQQKPNVIVGLEARGFLFGPSLALRLGAAFVPVRKKGKLPGPVETAGYQKEYGEDFFQMQKDGIKSGQRVLIVDDIIATGEQQLRHAQLLDMEYLTLMCRRLGSGGWFASAAIRRRSLGLRLYPRTRLPQGTR